VPYGEQERELVYIFIWVDEFLLQPKSHDLEFVKARRAVKLDLEVGAFYNSCKEISN
jgi:hypothetical protein